MKLPESVRVGPFDITIAEMPENEINAAYGLFSEEHQAILLRPKFTSTAQCAETLLHELLHAVWNVQAIDKKDGEERIVTKMSLGLAAVMRDNKELFRSILKALK